MHTIQKPEEPSANTTFSECVSSTQSSEQKKTLEQYIKAVTNTALIYDEKGKNKKWYLIAQETSKKTLKDFKDLYKNFIQRKSGREIYNKLINSVPHQICPLCGERQIDTLDHYLPKAHFPLLSITPYNLIPCCYKCNNKKATKIPETESTQTLHPYYDKVSQTQWLYAKFSEDSIDSLIFFINNVNLQNDILLNRIQYHFHILELNELYKFKSASLITGQKKILSEIFRAQGTIGVQKHLQDEADSWYSNQKNHWSTALYQAMANNTWFCNNGFNYD